MKKNKIIIIGGGVTGLMAAKELSGDFVVTVLEARNELGGRIRSFSLEDGTVIEWGPEFVHGRLPLTLALLKQAGIRYVKTEGRMYRKEGNSWKEQEEMIDGWDELLEKMEGQQEDISVDAFLKSHYPGNKNERLRQYITGYSEGFDLADPQRASIKALYKEWSHEGESYRVPAGYQSLVNFLEQACRNKGCEIITGDAVTGVNWEKDGVTVFTAGSKKYFANKAIITLPAGLMGANPGKPSIDFVPAIDHYADAFGDIGFGAVVRVVLQFGSPFWKKDTGFVLSNEAIPTWWTQNPLQNNLLTGWAGGPVAELLSQHSDSKLLEIALQSLSNIYTLPVDKLQDNLLRSFVFNWRKIPESLGAYSYSTTTSKQALELLRTPVANTLFFAGEALYEGAYPGTVEAALTSGKEMADYIIKLTVVS